MKPNLLSASTLVLLVIALSSVRSAQLTVFEDTFESGNLSQWIGQFGTPHHGQIVADPLDPANHVLTFTTASDIFSVAAIPASTSSKRYILSFDFLALPLGTVPPAEYGGFAGINTALGWGLPRYWVAGTYLPALNVPPSVATVLATDGQWHHYEIDFTEIIASNSMFVFQVMLQDSYDRGSIPGDVYFDNVRVLVNLVPPSFDRLILAVHESGLPANRKRPLLASLEAADASLAADDPARLLNQLQAFQNKVQAQVQYWDAALANTLILLAQQIILETQSSSGIIGQVLIYGCAAQRPGDICHARYQTGITVVTDRGRFITSLTTRSDGSFEIFLAPGDYVLIPDGAGQPTLPMVGTSRVHVDENRFTPVIIEYDSGIR